MASVEQENGSLGRCPEAGVVMLGKKTSTVCVYHHRSRSDDAGAKKIASAELRRQLERRKGLHLNPSLRLNLALHWSGEGR